LVKKIITAIFASLLGWVSTLATAQPASIQAVQLAQGVWFVQGNSALGSTGNRNFISNAGFFVTEEGVVVVDALGSPALAQELLREIHRVTPQALRYVVVTHYHADHIYGLQTLVQAGAKVIGHASAREYLNSDTAQKRLEASRIDLAPWIDANTRLVPADQWLDTQENQFRLGSIDFVVDHVGPAHTPEDVVVFVPQLGVLFAGDLFFQGRIPFVGQADSRLWIQALNRLMKYQPKIVIPGHGPASTNPMVDMTMTRDYLLYLRKTMGEAAKNMEPFEEVYAKTDWSRFESIPLFRVANRMNAYNTYLLMEQQGEP
jgi:glyoxylase-like metal-dependent hydrolase (beta-lactamase superfamily II)